MTFASLLVKNVFDILYSASFAFFGFLLFINVSSSLVTLASFVSYFLNFSSLGLSGDSRKITLSWYVQLVNCQLTTIPPSTLCFVFLLFLAPCYSNLHPSLYPHPTHEHLPPLLPCCTLPSY